MYLSDDSVCLSSMIILRRNTQLHNYNTREIAVTRFQNCTTILYFTVKL